MSAMPRVRTASGICIGYDEAGAGGVNATPIVFLHGVGSDKSVWHPQLNHFRRSRRAIAFDYPGYGDSDAAPAGAMRDDYASAILSGMDELGVAQAHVCGLSLGGVVAIAMHHAAPSACASLILADTFALHPDGGGIYQRSIAGSRDIAAMAEARVDVLLAQPADPDVRREVVETMSRIESSAYRIGAEAVWLADQRDRVSDIAAPTLIICGEEDKPTPPALSRELHEMIPGSQLAMIPRAGHLTNLERPGEFNRILDDFLRGVEA
jgi:3-oxoadipate enol-lactonase